MPFSARGVLELLEHQGGDGLEVVLCELVEVDDLVYPVDELGPQELLKSLHGPLPALFIGGAGEAHRARFGVAAGVGGHDDDCIFKVHRPAVGVGDPAVIQDLEQDVEHVRVGLLDLIEENDGVGLAADLLCQLARLVIAHIPRGSR